MLHWLVLPDVTKSSTPMTCVPALRKLWARSDWISYGVPTPMTLNLEKRKVRRKSISLPDGLSMMLSVDWRISTVVIPERSSLFFRHWTQTVKVISITPTVSDSAATISRIWGTTLMKRLSRLCLWISLSSVRVCSTMWTNCADILSFQQKTRTLLSVSAILRTRVLTTLSSRRRMCTAMTTTLTIVSVTTACRT